MRALKNVGCPCDAPAMSDPSTTWPLTQADIPRPAFRLRALPAGERLPKHLDLAWRLSLSVQAVIRADLVSGEVERGALVPPEIVRFQAPVNATTALGLPSAMQLTRLVEVIPDDIKLIGQRCTRTASFWTWWKLLSAKSAPSDMNGR